MISEIEKDETIKKRKFGGAREDELWAWIIDINPISFCDFLAQRIGAKPNFLEMLFTDPSLAIRCVFHVWTCYQYRLVGDGKWTGAREAIMNYRKRMGGP